MPHFTMEYSDNLEGQVDFGVLTELVRLTILDTGLFELGAIRVRAFRADAFAIADIMAENAFIDMSFRIGQGRSDKQKKSAGEAIFAAVEAHLGHLFKTPHFMLSLEIREIDPELSWKKNTIHPRIRGQK